MLQLKTCERLHFLWRTFPYPFLFPLVLATAVSNDLQCCPGSDLARAFGAPAASSVSQ